MSIVRPSSNSDGTRGSRVRLRLCSSIIRVNPSPVCERARVCVYSSEVFEQPRFLSPLYSRFSVLRMAFSPLRGKRCAEQSAAY